MNTPTCSMNYGRLIALPLLLMLLCACVKSNDPDDIRNRRAAKSKGDILIGAAGPWDSETYMHSVWNGIELAKTEINASGGVLGRKIRILKSDDRSDLPTAQRVAQSFADNPDVVAVVGHISSYISVPVSTLYEYAGIVMLSPLSTSPRLTRQNYRHIFRNIPNDTVQAHTLATYCATKNYRTILIYHANNDSGRGLANAFGVQAELLGLKIADRRSYTSASTDLQFTYDLTYWRDNYRFDAILIAGTPPLTVTIIHRLRAVGITAPILGGDSFDNSNILNGHLTHAESEGIVFTSVTRPSTNNPAARAFVEQFTKTYGSDPTGQSAQSYDALKLLASAIQKAGTTQPAKIAQALHATTNWPGVSGLITFNEKGDVVDMPVALITIHNDRFETLSPPAQPPTNGPSVIAPAPGPTAGTP